MILKAMSGKDAEIPINLYKASDGTAITGQVFATGDIKVALPGAAFANATVANIVEKGRGKYALQLTAAESGTTGAVYLDLVVGANDWQAHSWEETIVDAAQSTDVRNIAVTGAALNLTAESETLTTGSDAGGVGNTYAFDQAYDAWTAVGNAIDGYYQFDVSTYVGGVAVGAMWEGYLVGVANIVKVYAYNWGGAAWDQVGSIIGIAGTVESADEYELTSAHTSTVANGPAGAAGKVRIRFANTAIVGAVLNTDRILVGVAVVPLAAGVVPDVNVTKWNGSAVVAPNVAGIPKVDVVDWLGTAPNALVGGDLPANVKQWLGAAPASLTANGYVKIALLRWLTDDAAGTPLALSANLVQALTAAVANNAITAAAIATNAVDADALAADAVTEIQSGLATSAALATAQTAITDIQGDVDGIETTVATLATSAALATAQTAITDIQTDVDELQTTAAAIKTRTDLLPAVAAGTNTGLPIIGSQIPNANANAVGGLAIITAIGQGPGGTLKPNTVIDNYTYNGDKSPTAWRVRAFATAAAADTAYAAVNPATGVGNADDTDGEIEREKYTAEYKADKTLAALKRHKDL